MDLQTLSLIHEVERRAAAGDPSPRRRRPSRRSSRRWSFGWLRRRRPVATPMPGVTAVTPPVVPTSATGDAIRVRTPVPSS
jgi:hypothetical protein